VQRLRIRYAKRGPLRFTSHRDVARALERAIRRAGLPIAFSAGFSPHPKVSYAGAAPTGVASEAEYLEIGLATSCDPAAVGAALDAALPPGIDILAVVDAADQPDPKLAERIDASYWQVDLPGTDVASAAAAVQALLAAEAAPVERATKDGTRTVDVRAAIVAVTVVSTVATLEDQAAISDTSILAVMNRQTNGVYARMEVVVRHTTPAVRPDDILTALRSIGALSTPVTPVVTRLAQGLLLDNTSPEDAKHLIDPLGER
jgi:radical SAM-linked protein